MQTIKALTICNPYPEMILQGTKRVENRSWPTSFRGWLVLHAGRSREWMADGDAQCFPNLSWGAIVGRIEIVDCLPITRIRAGAFDQHPRLYWLSGHEHTFGPWCWVIDRTQRLRTPIPANGARGLWDIHADAGPISTWDWLPMQVPEDPADEFHPPRSPSQ